MPFTVPTPAVVRAHSRAEWDEYGYPVPASAGDPDPLAPVIAEAAAEITAALAGRGIVIDPEKVQDDSALDVILTKVHRMWTEYLAASNQPELIDLSADYEVLSSSGPGPASESRRNVGADLSNLHPWPPLDRLMGFVVKLWTDEITPSDLPDDVPMVSTPSVLPKPGAWIMDDPQRKTGASASIFGEAPTLGVARILDGSSGG